MPKKLKKLNPKSYTQKEWEARHNEALASGEIQLGDYLPELKPKAPKPK